jgi:tyrosyl-tRNA synthetase
MQGYDSVAMDVDGEVGGNDQTFNMLVGRNLLKEIKGKEKFVLTMRLLTDNSGTKMGKTEGNMLSLIDDANMMYGKVMAWEDSLMWNAFVLCTNVSNEEIDKMKEEIYGGKNPRDIKMRLAYEIARIYYGDSKAKKAEKEFIKTFQKKEIPDDIEDVKVNVGDSLADTLVARGFVKSKSDFRRLVDEGAVTIDGEKIFDFQIKVEKTPAVLKVGKKRFIRLV